jgi:putative ABC transport system permease protein
MDTVWQDLKLAARSLARNRGVSLVAVATLALGIGANTSIFSVVSAVLLRPLPYADEGRIVSIFEKRPRENAWTHRVPPADFIDWRARNSVFENVAAFSSTSADLIGQGEPERIEAAEVSWAFFDVLGVKPQRGRLFRAGDESDEGSSVAVITHGLWRRRLGGAPDIVGRSINLSGLPHTVIGVLPEGFLFPQARVELWIPFDIPPGLAQVRAAHFLSVFARLKDGVTIEQAAAAMATLGAQIEKDHPDTNLGHYPSVVPLRQSLSRTSKDALFILLGAVGLVLLAACANVANLLLARGLGRSREMAIRTALGAGRGRLMRLVLTESVLLAGIAGAAGFLVATWGISALTRMVPPNFVPPGFREFEPDARVLAFTTLATILTGLLFGMVPALQASQVETTRSLKEGGGGAATGARHRVRSVLLVTQIALALTLLVGSGLLVRSFLLLLEEQPGFERPEAVLTARMVVPRNRYPDDARLVGFYDALLERVAALPGVEAAGAISQLPLSGQDNRTGVEIEGRAETTEPTRAHDRSVAGDYFRAMGVRLLSGRLPDERDAGGAPPVMVINRTMARHYWPGEDPTGRRVRILGAVSRWHEVVGVVEDVKHWGLDGEVHPEMYVPLPQRTTPLLNMVVRSRAAPLETLAAVREQVRSLDPSLPLSDVRTLEDVLRASVAPRRFYMAVLGMFAAIALGLACLGIYSVMSVTVAQRTREIGIRVAVGAGARDIHRLVLAQGLRLTLAGVGVGLAAAFALTRFLRAALFGVSALDPATFAGVAFLVTLIALLACLLPARRATRVDPVAALRSE